MYERIEHNLVLDDEALLRDYHNLIKWGIDTLPHLAPLLIPVYDNSYSPFCSSLDVYNVIDSVATGVFSSHNIVEFKGTDSKTTDDKLSRLISMMYIVANKTIWDKFVEVGVHARYFITPDPD